MNNDGTANELATAIMSAMDSFKVLIDTADGLRQQLLEKGWSDENAQAVATAWLTKYMLN